MTNVYQNVEASIRSVVNGAGEKPDADVLANQIVAEVKNIIGDLEGQVSATASELESLRKENQQLVLDKAALEEQLSNQREETPAATEAPENPDLPPVNENNDPTAIGNASGTRVTGPAAPGEPANDKGTTNTPDAPPAGQPVPDATAAPQ